MSKPDATASPRHGMWILGLVLAIPLLYAFSIGPVLYCAHWRYKYSAGYYRVYDSYEPLRRVATAASLRPALFAYLRLWRVPVIRVAGKTGTAQSSHRRAAATPTPTPRHAE